MGGSTLYGRSSLTSVSTRSWPLGVGGGLAAGRGCAPAPTGAVPCFRSGPVSTLPSPPPAPASLHPGPLLGSTGDASCCSGPGAAGDGFVPALTSHRLFLRQPSHQRVIASLPYRFGHAGAAGAGCAAG